MAQGSSNELTGNKKSANPKQNIPFYRNYLKAQSLYYSKWRVCHANFIFLIADEPIMYRNVMI
ncbi:hypothetical protein HMPREF1570_4207 [Klebsiella oxytoca KA-2]|nr:hypothetical protein HMPREF1570_4207 [Klebsiella oxytoca KA-2]